MLDASSVVQITGFPLLVDVVCQLHVRAMFLLVFNLDNLLDTYVLLAPLPLLLRLHLLEHIARLEHCRAEIVLGLGRVQSTLSCVFWSYNIFHDVYVDVVRTRPFLFFKNIDVLRRGHRPRLFTFHRQAVHCLAHWLLVGENILVIFSLVELSFDRHDFLGF